MTTPLSPKRPMAAARSTTMSALDVAFATGSTAVFLAIMASLVGALSLYFR